MSFGDCKSLNTWGIQNVPSFQPVIVGDVGGGVWVGGGGGVIYANRGRFSKDV